MSAILTTLWQMLPAHLRHQPEIQSLRIDHLEHRMGVVENRLDEQSHQPEPQSIETPVGKLPVQYLPFALLIGLWLLAYRPDIALKLFGL